MYNSPMRIGDKVVFVQSSRRGQFGTVHSFVGYGGQFGVGADDPKSALFVEMEEKTEKGDTERVLCLQRQLEVVESANTGATNV